MTSSSLARPLVALLLGVAAAVVTPAIAEAAPQFSDGTKGALNPASGTVTFDTDAGTWSGAATGTGGRVVTQANSVEIMVFDFTTITVPVGVTILAKGSRSLALVATGPVQIDGVIDVSGQDSGSSIGQRGGAGGPGGGGGGAGGDAKLPATPVAAIGGLGGLGGGGDGYVGHPVKAHLAGADGVGGLFNAKRGFEGQGGAGGTGSGSASINGIQYGGGGGGGGPGGGVGGSYGPYSGCALGEGIGSGGGGGHATPGAGGTRMNSNLTIPGGPAYGTDDLAVLQGGSGGGGSAEDIDTAASSNGGGGGGGAVMVTSLVSITISATAKVVARGGSARGDLARGGKTLWGAGGGGGGGAIYLDAPTVTNAGELCAAGGLGGVADATDPNHCPNQPTYTATGGGGGGGRVVLFGASTAGTVCVGTGSTKVGNFKCVSNKECAGGTCDPNTHECVPAPIVDAGADAFVDATSPLPDAGGDASGTGDTLAGGGCSCHEAGHGPSSMGAPFGGAVALGALLLRRRRARTRT